jgi:hypothetical protein
MADETAQPADTAEPGNDATTDTDDGAVQDLAAEIEKWKSLSHRHEQHAKNNAEAALRLKKLEDANKSEVERQAETLAFVERERDAALVETARLRAAVKHGLSDDDLDLLGTGSPDEIEARASKLAARLAASGQPRKPGPDPTQGTAADPNTSTAAQFAAAISGL